jgi:hypothetical protein
MFCAPRIVFGGTEGVGSRFHVLPSETHFRRYRGRRVPFSCFAFPDSFSAVPRDSGLVFKFCGPGLVFIGTEGVGSRFHILSSRTRFRRYRGPRILFSCFALPNTFSAVPRESGLVFKFCGPGLTFGGAVGVGSRFHVLRVGLIFVGTEGVGSRFYVLRSRTRFLRCRVRRVPFSCFALPHSFSALPRASGPVFMFCAP